MDNTVIEIPAQPIHVPPDQCPHLNFNSRVNIHSEEHPITHEKTRYCQVQIMCLGCNTPFSFKGGLKESSQFEAVGTTDHFGFQATIPIVPGHVIFRELMESRQATAGVSAMGTPAEQEPEPTVTRREGKKD